MNTIETTDKPIFIETVFFHTSSLFLPLVLFLWGHVSHNISIFFLLVVVVVIFRDEYSSIYTNITVNDDDDDDDNQHFPSIPQYYHRKKADYKSRVFYSTRNKQTNKQSDRKKNIKIQNLFPVIFTHFNLLVFRWGLHGRMNTRHDKTNTNSVCVTL